MTLPFPQWLKQTAADLGAHSAASIRLDNPRLGQAIAENNLLVDDWLKAGNHGEMDYLQRMFPEKADPWSHFPFAKSVIVLTFSNLWGSPLARHPFPSPGADALVGYISAYARECDYHKTGQALLASVKSLLGDDVEAEIAVDTSAVYERLFASIGGLGVIGGNNLIRVPGAGTRIYLGCLFIDRELPEVISEPKFDFSCESCCACLQHCPTGAIQYGRPIDGPKCISYLTIEKRGLLSRTEAAAVGRWLFGCDCCTASCPPKMPDLRIPVDLEWLLKSPTAEIRKLIKGNASGYAGVTQLRKNAVVVLKNMKTARANDLLRWVAQNSGSELVRNQVVCW